MSDAAERAADRIVGPFTIIAGSNPDQRWVDAEREARMVCKRKVAAIIDEAIAAETARLRAALEEIASYDDGNGCCPYGCDTPSIARASLEQKGGE